MLCYGQTKPSAGGNVREQAKQDTTSQKAAADSLRKALPQGDISTTINYSARDSMRFDVINRRIFLFGDSKITYGDIALKSEYIDIDWSQNLLKSYGKKDSTGKETGKPEFTDKGETYNSSIINYNFKTRKGKISGVSTKYGEGYIVGDNVKKMDNDDMYMRNGLYTTCDLPHPHFGIRAKKLKVVPGKVVVASMFNLEIADVPTPLGFAFGMFPQPKRRTSGFVFPQYGETRERGFFLSNGGFYFVITDNLDISLLGEIHTKGGYGFTATSNYKKRYAYDGNFRFQYNRRINEIPGRLEPNVVNDFNIAWSHTPQSKGDSRFSANVNAGTNTFGRNNAPQLTNFQSSAFNSNISYNKTFTGTPFTAGANLRHEQNVVTKVVSVFPEANVGMNRIYPFKGKNSNSKSILSQLNISYTGRTRATLSNVLPGATLPFKTPTGDRISGDTLKVGSELQRIVQSMRWGAQHNIPISTAVTLFKYLTTSFSANYSEVWAPEKYNYTYLGNSLVRIDTVRGLSRFYNYDVSTSFNTRFYAFFYPKIKSVEAMRLTINPNLSFSLTPDFGDPRFGFFQNVQTSDDPAARPVRQSRFSSSGIFGNPRSGRQGSISFGLTNTLEMKLRSKGDSASGSSTDSKTKKKDDNKITLLDNISINSSYNIAADSFNLAPISFSARTSLLKKININFSGNLDPYAFEVSSVENNQGVTSIRQRRIPQYAWKMGQGLGTLSTASVAIGTNFTPPQAKKELKSDKASKEELDHLNRNRHLYVDFNLPWTLNINYNLSLTRQGFDKPTMVQTFNFSGDVKLTNKWKVGVNSGYDFVAKDFSFTQLTIYRDLHCWQMNVSWIPFGPRAGYTLDINVKASILQDLKLSRRNLWYFR